jgi:hypothetical protein
MPLKLTALHTVVMRVTQKTPQFLSIQSFQSKLNNVLVDS